MYDSRSTGRWVRAYRDAQSLSQADLAERSGLTRGSISDIETGRRRVAVEELAALALALRVPVSLLLGDHGFAPDLKNYAWELYWLGVTDLHVPDAVLPVSPHRPEEVVALALMGNRPSPRVLEALPVVLAWNPVNPRLLAGFAEVHDPRALHRAAWLADVALTIHRDYGFPGGVADAVSLEGLLIQARIPEEPDVIAPDESERVPPVAKRWNVVYTASQADFRRRAAELEADNRERHGGYSYRRETGWARPSRKFWTPSTEP